MSATPYWDKAAHADRRPFLTGRAAILRAVRKLLPGHVMTVTAGRVREPVRYWRPPLGARVPPGGRSELEDELHETLARVVDEQLVADVPVALLLSGGVDSGVVAALAARRKPLRTFTMAFGASGVDERVPARTVAQHVGSEHAELVVEPADLVGGLEDAARAWPDEEALPESIGPYRIVRLVERGGMGTVYEAEQPSPRRRVALKVMRPELSTSEGRRRFVREATLLAALHDPGIAQVYEQGHAETPSGPVLFLAMEFVEGRTLDRWLAEGAPPIPDSAAGSLARRCRRSWPPRSTRRPSSRYGSGS